MLSTELVQGLEANVQLGGAGKLGEVRHHEVRLCQGGQQGFLSGAEHQNQKSRMENLEMPGTTPRAHSSPHSQS